MPAVEAAVRSTGGVLASKQRCAMGGGGRERTKRGDGIIQGASPSESPQQHGRLRDSGVNAALRNLAALLSAVRRLRPGLLFFFHVILKRVSVCSWRTWSRCVRAWCHPLLRQCCGAIQQGCGTAMVTACVAARGCARMRAVHPSVAHTRFSSPGVARFPRVLRRGPRAMQHLTHLYAGIWRVAQTEHGSTPTGVGHTRIVLDVAVCRPDPRPRPLQHLAGRSRGRGYTDSNVHNMPRLAQATPRHSLASSVSICFTVFVPGSA